MLYNDLTRRKEPFEPLEKGRVGFYTCGPTVYDYFHIGNARPFIVFDALRRFLEQQGYEVVYVQNFTDIDDKMINRAAELGISVGELADRFIEAYFEDADALGIRRPTVTPKATEHIPEIISLVERILEKGHAYVVDGDVFFDVQSYPCYGKLSKQTLDDLQSGARVDVNPSKKHPLDFILWKSQKAGEPFWDSPWGKGRPGWHIECSAMAMKYLGETIDIHSGGSDLVFPHHENEIAQAEAATGRPFVRYWIHNGYLMINEEKMSKSLGNFLTARNARKKFPPVAIRLFMLSAHYRSPINFSPENLYQAQNGAQRLRNCWYDLANAPVLSEKEEKGADEKIRVLEETRARFDESLCDDFNTAAAIGHLYEAVRTVNQVISETRTLHESFHKAATDFLKYADETLGVIGVGTESEDAAGPDEEEIGALVNERNCARKNKDFARADAIRDRLASMGIILEDTPEGTRWKRSL
ncbi:MAG: cysteine--tRNA ligase [Thermovirgaceae bacterium]